MQVPVGHDALNLIQLPGLNRPRRNAVKRLEVSILIGDDQPPWIFDQGLDEVASALVCPGLSVVREPLPIEIDQGLP